MRQGMYTVHACARDINDDRDMQAGGWLSEGHGACKKLSTTETRKPERTIF